MLSEDKKEFIFALAVLSYVMLLSTCIVALRMESEHHSDLEAYYLNEASQQAKHPLPTYQVFFLLSNSVDSFGLAACMLPTMIFTILIRFSSNRKTALLALFAVPFMLNWETISQNLSILFFISAIAMRKNKMLAGTLFLLGCASHRFGYLLGAGILAIFTVPMQNHEGALRSMRNVALAAVSLIWIVASFYHCEPFNTFSRSIPLIGLWLWFVAESKDARFSAIFIFIITASMALQGDFDGNRVLWVLQPLSVLVMAEEKKEASAALLAFLLVIGLALIFFNLVENANPNFTGAASQVETCRGIDVPLLAEKIVHRIFMPDGVMNGG